jgi:sugar phosphate isomerase/epimerase
MRHTRREFFGVMAGAAVWNSQRNGSLSIWTEKLGLQVYTVRDRLDADFEGTLTALSSQGYSELELFGSLGGRSPREIRAILDRLGLAAVSTHIAIGPGPDLESNLEAYQIIGHRYTAVRVPPAPGGGGGNSRDGWLRQAETLNMVGQAGKPYGIRALVHNHTQEFEPLAGGDGTGYDVLLAETDPDLVAMELDIGWANIAGQDVLAMFRTNPGRYRLWHVKDVADLGTRNTFVPVGTGEIDYRPVFEAAAQAGLEHYFIEQDNAPDSNSIAAARTSANNLRNMLR